MTTTFVLRARAAPTDPDAFLAEVGLDAHTEIIAHTLMNAMFVAQSHRDNVIVHVVLESTADFSRTVTFTAEELSNIGGFHEAALLEKVSRALRVSVGMRKEQEKQVEPYRLIFFKTEFFQHSIDRVSSKNPH